MITFKELGRYGRFGNQLFQIASTIGIAIKSGQPFGFPKWINHDHKDRFGSGEDVDVQKFFENKLPGVVDVPYQDLFIQWGYHDINLRVGNWNLIGHMQSDKYFMHCIDTVRHYLKMKNEYEQNDFVAVHYRAGDYIDDPNAYHPRCSLEYYQNAIEYFPNATFLVFSDNMIEAAKMFDPNKMNVLFSMSNDYIEDFKRMKACKHFICANSSYSLMAAILSERPEKKIVCPKKWFGDVAGINGNDCYPQNSIVL